MKSILGRLLHFCMIVSLSSASFSFAQIDKGTIAGTVKDAQGAVVPDAKITVTRTDTQQQRSLVTNKSGEYSAELLTAGTYSVAAEAPGFNRTELGSVQVGVNQVVRLDIELKVGSASQTVEVTAAPPILSTETSSLSTIETGQRIVNLPLNGPTPLSFPMTRPIQVPEDRGRIAFTIPRTSPMTWPARQRSGARPPESRRSLASTIRRRSSSPTLLRDRPSPINLEIQAKGRCVDRTRWT
jgi:hypothetical protein